jgi:hypothetical protein
MSGMEEEDLLQEHARELEGDHHRPKERTHGVQRVKMKVR